jgi:glycosyltransferase involved in cell wall biosynthesis
MARVVLFVNIPRFFLTHRLPFALAARDAGHEVHVLTAQDGSAHPDTIRAAGLPVHTLPLQQHGASPLREATTLRAVHSAYRRLRPDLVHHVGVKPAIYGGIAARATGVPATVCTLSGLGAAFTGESAALRALRPIVRAGLGWALRSPTTRVIFQNPENRDLFVARGVVAPHRCRIIRGSGVDMRAFRPAPEEPGPPVVLFAGRVLWSKGVGDFVRAAGRLRGSARFAIAALHEPNNPDAVPRATIEAWRDAGLIEWWGQMSDMPAALRRVHVACLPTRYGEGVPKFLIEAAASGRAIVATDAPGCREVVRNGTNGFLVPPDDWVALSEALRRLIADPALRHRMGCAGRALVEDELSLERVNRDTLEVYAELLAQRSARCVRDGQLKIAGLAMRNETRSSGT